MSNCLLIILLIGSFVTFGGFPSRFSKCCFHSFILSCWFAAFNFSLAVLFLLLTSFIVCQAILDCLSSTESLILSIWFCMYSVCSFRYMPANWYCAFSSFWAFVFVGFLHNLHRNNYPEPITSAPRNLDRRIHDNTRKLTTVCLPYVKGQAERI